MGFGDQIDGPHAASDTLTFFLALGTGRGDARRDFAGIAFFLKKKRVIFCCVCRIRQGKKKWRGDGSWGSDAHCVSTLPTAFPFHSRGKWLGCGRAGGRARVHMGSTKT